MSCTCGYFHLAPGIHSRLALGFIDLIRYQVASGRWVENGYLTDRWVKRGISTHSLHVYLHDIGAFWEPRTAFCTEVGRPGCIPDVTLASGML
jgi:hypothetical protein